MVAARRDEPAARDALVLGLQLAKAEGSRLVIAAAWSAPPHLATAYDDEITREVARGLATLARRVPEGVPCEVVVQPALSTARGLHRIAVEREADVVVLGAATMRMLGHYLAPVVIHDAPFAVAVAPHGYQRHSPVRDVVVGWDGSNEAAAAVSVGRALADDLDGAVRVLRATEPGEHVESDPGYVEALPGRAPDVLAQVAGDSAWIVVGSRGFGALRRAVLGSTSAAVVEEPAAPVLIVPRGVRAAQDAVSTPATGRATSR